MALKQISIEREYEKNPDISPEDIKKLRAWLDTQPHLPGNHLSDPDLMLVYHCCEKSMQVSKHVLDLHYSLRTLFALYFEERSFDKRTEFVLNTILFCPLPTSTPEGYRVIYLRLIDMDPKNFFLNDTVKVFMMIFDLMQYEEGTWPGFVIIIDMDKSVLGHLARVEVMTIRKVLYFVQECMLAKLKKVVFMNAPYFMDKVMLMLKPFLKKALLNIITIHPVGTDAVYRTVPKKAFPKEEGGEYKDHETIKDETIQRLQANEEFFRSESQRRVNESLRPGGKTTTEANLFGIEGSFKKLDID